MRYNYTKRAFFAWLTLMLSFTALGLSAQTKEISTQEELLEALQHPATRVDEIKELHITEEGIPIDQLVTVNPGTFRM